MEPTEVAVRYASHEELELAWNRFIKHKALATPIDPPPPVGAIVHITLRAAWSQAVATFDGRVMQATPAFTILELAPPEPVAIMNLIAMGLTQAAELTPATEETLAGPVPAPKPDPHPAAPPPPAPVEPPPPPDPVGMSQDNTVEDVLREAPAEDPAPPSTPAPEPAGDDDDWNAGEGFSAVASPAEPAPRVERPIAAVKFTPPPSGSWDRPARPPSGSWTPARPPSGSWAPAQTPPPPHQSRATSSVSMTHDSDPDDPRFLSGLTGPAGTDTEAALPAIADVGDLGEVPWRDSLLKLHLAKKTGVLVLHGFREIRWGYFVDGCPVHFAGDHPHPGEFLSDFLTGDGPLTEAEWVDALRMQKLTGIAAGQYLVQKGKLSQSQLDEGLHARASRITERLVAANFGRWSFHPLEGVRHAFRHRGVDVVPLLFDVERRDIARMDDDALVERMTPFYDDHVIEVASRQHLLKQCSFDADEQAVVDEYLSGGWTIKELLGLRALPERPLLRLLMVLQGLGIVEMAHEEGERAQRNRVERRLFVALRNITRWPNFEALHCHWTATQQEVEFGYRDTLAEWDPARFEAVADDRIRDLCRQIRAKADSLYEQLKTREGRDALRKDKVDGSQRLMACDLLFKQVEMELFKGNLGVGRVIYERILELVPKGPDGREYRDAAREKLRDPAIANAKYPGEGFQEVFKKLDKLVQTDD